MNYREPQGFVCGCCSCKIRLCMPILLFADPITAVVEQVYSAFAGSAVEARRTSVVEVFCMGHKECYL